jgi:hypothetical protein
MSEIANRNLCASAQSKMAISEHDQELHAPGFSPAVLDNGYLQNLQTRIVNVLFLLFL